MSNQIYDTIIIGGGPAGLTAGLYNGRAGMKTLVIESPTVIGQVAITADVENYPGFESISGPELIKKFRDQAIKWNAEIVSGNVNNLEKTKKGWKVFADDKVYESLAVIIATGAVPRKLNIPGEDKFIGRGVSYCATCDGPFYKGKEIVAIGGGDTAAEESVFLTRFASKITMIHRRDRLRAIKTLADKAIANPKIEIIWNSVVTEIVGDQSGVTSVKTKDIKSNKTDEIKCFGAFIFAGYIPNTDFAKTFVERDKNNYILSNEKMETETPGLFTCGDCRKKMLRQIVTATGEGAVAAVSAQHYIEELKGTAYR